MKINNGEPLAARMRPSTIAEIAGQTHILGEGKLLRRVIEADRLTNIILYGPPGCGKTTLAEVVAKTTKRSFVRLSGVLSGVADIRRICESARGELGGRGTILFIDEIHRFNKSQQDVLLPYIEDGTVVLIGATTHNPNFFVNTPLLSRSLVFELHPLDKADIVSLLKRAIADKEKGFGAWIKEIALKGLDTAATIVNAVAKVFNAEASKGLAGVIIGVLAAALIIGTIALVANTVKTEQNTKAAQESADKKKEQAEGARAAAEAAREELDAVIELTNAYMDALKIYEETGEGKEELRKAAFEAIDAMNLEGHELEILAGNYANLTKEI
jgi:replication-associated recombination protein RarA